MKTFTFDGLTSSSLGFYINGSGVFDAPEPDLEYLSIPGKDGDLIYNRKRFNNIDIEYAPVFALSGFKTKAKNLQAWLLSHKGYFRLEDDYQPAYFRMASVKSAIEVDEINWSGDGGSMDIVFNCKPQLFLKSGETEAEFTANGTIENPTRFTAKPLIEVFGTGQVTIGSRSFTVLSHNFGSITIDCDRQDCYSSTSNANQNVQIGDYFPELPPDTTGIALGTGITKVIITPRWWTV
jgi:phage-related protein